MPSIDFSPNHDGYIRYDLICIEDPEPTYVHWTNLPWIWGSGRVDPTWGFLGRRGYAYFDTSAIPLGATVTSVKLTLFSAPTAAYPSLLDAVFLSLETEYASVGTDPDFYDLLSLGSIYTQGYYADILDVPIEIELGSGACTNIMSHLGWFAVAVLIDEAAVTFGEESKVYYSQDSDTSEYNVRPFLTVTYTLGGGNNNYILMF